MRAMRRWLCSGAWGMLALAAVLAPPAARADVNSVTGTPASANVPLGRTGAVTVAWTVVTDFLGPTTISSPQGVFIDPVDGFVLGTVSRSLSRANVSGVATFVETVQVPAAVTVRAQRRGFSRLAYTRFFTDPIAGSTGAIVLDITSPAGAGFAVTRLALRFTDGAPVKVVSEREALVVLADLSFTGAGLLDAVWEVATPPSTLGSPVFRPLRTVRQYLVAGDRITLSSPELPTDLAGLYLVRLRVTAPEVGFELPAIRYFVGDGAPGKAVAVPPALPGPVSLEAPAHLAQLEAGTRFAWRAAPGARAYQLEFYAKPGGTAPPEEPLAARLDSLLVTAVAGPVVTGVALPAAQVQTSLPPPVRERLQPGRAYLWRVVAIGADGAVLAESPLREIRVP